MKFFYNAPIERGALGEAMPSASRSMLSLPLSIKKLPLGVKLAAVLLLSTCLQVSAKVTTAQKLSISFHNGSLEKLFAEIEKKTPFVFFYDAAILKGTKPVTVEMREASVDEILRVGLKGQALDYSINDKTIFVKKSEEKSGSVLVVGPGNGEPAAVTGAVYAENGAPLMGASVYIKKLNRSGITNNYGEFALKNVPDGQYEVEVSYVGYEKTRAILSVVNHHGRLEAKMKQAIGSLDETVVIPYGTTTKRLNLGDVTKVTSKEIEQQPVSNPLAALEGRVPGMVVTQTTGAPGGGFTVQIRGLNSLSNGTNPFIVIDGVPYNSIIPLPAGTSYGLINNTLQGGSPLNFINPSDIESIEVLKDADATAIYGSRAANGAILITTKKGKSGDMRFNLRAYSGFTSPAHDMDFMNTQQYLSMRHEAFKNDSLQPSSSDYDINGVWDTTRYTNWSKELIGNTAHYSNFDASVSGGTANAQYLIGAGYNKQTTGYPRLIAGDGADRKASVHFNFNGISPNKKFKITLTGSYVSDVNTVQSEDFSTDRINLPPDAPSIFKADGTLNWAPLSPGQAGTWTNPYGSLYIKYRGVTNNLIGSSIISYSILPNLEIKTSLGYNNVETNEIQANPAKAFDPGYNLASGFSNFNTVNTHSWIAEPQIEYRFHFGKGSFAALVGSSFNDITNDTKRFAANGFISDALLENLQSATQVSSMVSNSEYKYTAVFSRLNFNWQDKYLINLTARRDGSSRFGPERQFADFGAIGLGWIFSNEGFIQRNLSFLSFGKLRASYGTTGSDQIGDYRFLNLYNVTDYPYNGNQGLYPSNLFNPDLAWELTKKLEGGIELGFLKDRINLQASYYRNRSGNQLMTIPLSLVTGFPSIPANLNATIQNSGIEVVLNTINIKTKNFSWSTSFNFSSWKNKLVSYTNLASSPYASTFIIGQPITIKQVYKYAGINDTTGAYQFYTAKGNLTYTPDSRNDRTAIVNPAPRYYGGILNSLHYKGFTLDFLFQFVKQVGVNWTSAVTVIPGIMINEPARLSNDHWQKPGDKKTFQRFTQSYGLAGNAFLYATSSSFAYSDASFIRLKNLAISYELPGDWKKKINLQDFRIFAQGQNLFTITNYFGIDPESQGIGLPPMRVWTMGFQVSF